MVKRGKNQKQKHWSSVNSKSKLKKDEEVDVNDMDDEIDAFHKKRDMIPLDVDADSGDSDEDDEQAVFNYKGIDSDDDEDDDDEEEEDEEEYPDTSLAKKIIRQQKFLKEKTGGDEEFLDDAEQTEEPKPTVWSRGKGVYYGADNEDELQSSDDDISEIIKLQKERAQDLTIEDFGLQMDDDDSVGEPTMEERGKTQSSGDMSKGDSLPMYEEVKKDLGAMSKDEQMDAVYRSAPELVGLLDELNHAVNVLETRVNPLIGKVKKVENGKKDEKNYLEVKQLLLHSYCQAIVFYLLLKSEGNPVRDHPVINRIVEIKSLLDKMQDLDQFIPDGAEDALLVKSDAEHPTSTFNSTAELNELIPATIEKNDAPQAPETAEPVKMQPTKLNEKKRKLQDPPVSSENDMKLQFRAAVEEKLKQKIMTRSDVFKTDGGQKKLRKTETGKLDTAHDFDDDVVQLGGVTRNNETLSSKLSRIIPSKKIKSVSGDDDLPARDDLGERRRKNENRVLSRVGINSNNDGVQPENEPESLSNGGDGIQDDVEVDGSEDDMYTQVERARNLKLKMKGEKLARNPQDGSEADVTLDGKRYISASMEKNRGLTRNRKKQNPRVVKRQKFEKAKKRRLGQVREMRQQSGPYEWEKTGINPRVSKSIKFKSG